MLIVGAGQGLLVEQLQTTGHKVEGVDLSPQMIKYALTRRGLKLIEADARKLPSADRTYNTTIIATGVVDFLDDEGQIGLIVNEARTVLRKTTARSSWRSTAYTRSPRGWQGVLA